MKQIQKYLSIILSLVLVLGSAMPVRAFDVPTAPTAPEAPSAPTAPTDPTAPEAPSAPTAPEAQSAPSPDEGNENHHDESDDEDEESNSNQTQSDTQTDNSNAEPGTTDTTSNEPILTTGEDTGSVNDGGNVGSTTIDTGNADTSGVVIAEANFNVSVTGGEATTTDGGISIVNTGNGSDSANTGSATVSNTNNTNQSNFAVVTNGLNGESNSGDNTSSKNTGGDTTITSGDANITGTMITAVNTNIDGVMVSEFNVVDDHVGDIILDFAAGCVSGCGAGDTTIKNTGNGANSTNTGSLDLTNEDITFQTNDATVENNMTLEAVSGDNTADKNTGGDSTITSGDANVTANVLTFANNNLSGDVIYGVVNIYGDLVGDIIFSDEQFLACCGTSATLANTGNGTGSTNTTAYNLDQSDELYQTNTAVIDNYLDIEAQTGENETSQNTNGNNSITTGDSNVEAQVVNVANTNVDGGNWWLVLVNQAGTWLGQIIGGTGNGDMAGSLGTEFIVDEAGEITITNSGNGAESTNTGTVNETNTNTTVQTNTAHVVNNVDLTANTGGNSTSKNTGGNNSITTGDATVMANIINFVNNNIATNGKLFVTVVNVFGSWLGDFVAPGAHKAQAQASADPESSPAIGGAQVGSSQSQTGSSTSTSTTGTGTTAVTYAAGNGTRTVLRGTGSYTGAMVLSTKITKDAGAGQTSVQGSRTIHINLAWLILLLPCAILLFVGRKRFGHLLKKNTSAV